MPTNTFEILTLSEIPPVITGIAWKHDEERMQAHSEYLHSRKGETRAKWSDDDPRREALSIRSHARKGEKRKRRQHPARLAALDAGLVHYDFGVPCSVDPSHGTIRYTKNDHCLVCAGIKRDAWKAQHPERVTFLGRRNRLRNLYNLTHEQYDEMLVKQNNSCAICSGSLIGVKTCIDHDHKTGDVRGILCYGCNTGIGMLQDSPSVLREAALYLERAANANL